MRDQIKILHVFYEKVLRFFYINFGLLYLNFFFKEAKTRYCKINHWFNVETFNNILDKLEKTIQNIFKYIKQWKFYLKEWNWKDINLSDWIVKHAKYKIKVEIWKKNSWTVKNIFFSFICYLLIINC